MTTGPGCSWRAVADLTGKPNDVMDVIRFLAVARSITAF
jgi:hypothetical protein